MSKIKSHKGLLKRIRVTSKGKVMHKRAGTSHLMTSFTGKRKREMRRKLGVHKSVAKIMERMLRQRIIGRGQG